MIAETVAEFYPAKLPPLRSDTPTLVVGRLKGAKSLSFDVQGTVAGNIDGRAGSYARTGTLGGVEQVSLQPASTPSSMPFAGSALFGGSTPLLDAVRRRGKMYRGC